MLTFVGGLRKKVCANAGPLFISRTSPDNSQEVNQVTWWFVRSFKARSNSGWVPVPIAASSSHLISSKGTAASRLGYGLLLQQHVELQELFVGKLLTAAGLQMLLQKASSLLCLPAQLFAVSYTHLTLPTIYSV